MYIFILAGLLGFQTWPHEYQTGKEMTAFYLPDSSYVRLNSMSKIVYTEWQDKRICLLHGEAFIQVKHHKNPFILQTDSFQIVSPGSFNIRNYIEDSLLRLMAYSDSVAITTPSQQYALAPKNVFQVYKGVVRTLTPQKYQDDSTWIVNRWHIDGMPMAVIINKMARYNGYAVHYTGSIPGINDATMAGHVFFDKWPFENFLQFAQKTDEYVYRKKSFYKINFYYSIDTLSKVVTLTRNDNPVTLEEKPHDVPKQNRKKKSIKD